MSNSPLSAADPRWAELVGGLRRQWPAISLSDEVFFAYLAERCAAVEDRERLFHHAADLFLACASAQGDGFAIREIEQRYFGDEVDAAARRSGLVAHDELRQQLRAKLFVGPPPKIASYAGRSSLRTWLRAVVGRIVIDAARAWPREEPASFSAFDVASDDADPHRRLQKHIYQGALEEALRVAANRMDPKERNLLRFSVAEGLSIDQIGAIYGVHRVTAARWLQGARATFAENIRQAMIERLDLSPSDFDSALRVALSQLDVTIARMFAGDGR